MFEPGLRYVLATLVTLVPTVHVTGPAATAAARSAAVGIWQHFR